MTRLSPRDAVFVYDETDRHLSNIAAFYVFGAESGEALAPAEISAWLRARLGYAAFLNRRLRRVWGDLELPRWEVDPGFSVDDHLGFETPGDWPAARARIAAIAATRLDLDRPPWRIQVLTGVRGVPGVRGAATIVVLLLHHSAGDGIATRELESRLFARPELPVSARRAAAGRTLPAPLVAARIAGSAGLGALRFADGLRRSKAAAEEVRARAASGDLHEPRASRPATRFNRATAGTPIFDMVTLPLADVRALRAGHPERVTVNDILLSTVAGALSAYLAERGERPAGSLAAMVPLSTRPVADWDSANRIAQLFVDLHTDIDDPVLRLHAVAESARREKRRGTDPAVLRREARVETAPPWLLRLAGWARAQRDFTAGETIPYANTTISNVPPAADALELCGAPLIRAQGVLPPLDGDALRHLISSQGGELVITFSSYDAILPDPAHYADLLRASFDELAAAIATRGTAPA
ncbi:wax ester/triacylglycerol synthase family O-acyltransferase [Nocardia thailandica]